MRYFYWFHSSRVCGWYECSRTAAEVWASLGVPTKAAPARPVISDPAAEPGTPTGPLWLTGQEPTSRPHRYEARQTLALAA
jgi:hypothetical protein